jgi:predicted nuclease of predicted toxin-antitoxin system
MRIKLDENMPASLMELLVSLGHDTDTAVSEGLAGKDDDIIWYAAQKAGRLLITQDLDFSDLRKFTPGRHHGVVLFRLQEPGWPAIVSRARSVFETLPLQEWRGCLVVITQHKIRVRAPLATENDNQ